MEKVENRLKNEFRIIDKVEVDKLFDLVGDEQLSDVSLLVYFGIIFNMDFENRLTLSKRKLSVYLSVGQPTLDKCIEELDTFGAIRLVDDEIYVNPHIAVRSSCMDRDILELFDSSDLKERRRSKFRHLKLKMN